jgi:hypothetical protein
MVRIEHRYLGQRGGEDLGRWLVTEAPRIQDLKGSLVFGRRHGAGRARSRRGWSCRLDRAQVAVQRSPLQVQRAAGSRPAHLSAELVGGDKVVSPAGLPVEAAAPEKPADLTAATDNPAKLLGKKKRSFNKPWYDGLESELKPAPQGRVQ